MYYVDSPTKRVDVLDYDPETGDVANRRPFALIEDGVGVPDGLAIDVEDGVWVALYGGAQVRRYGPAARSTPSCSPGRERHRVRVRRRGRAPDVHHHRASPQPAGGSLFIAEPGIAGPPARAFASMTTITGVRARDIRFPTSQGLHGSDAMNPDPDYSAAYVVLEHRRRPRGPRLHVHDRARERAVRRGDRGARAARAGPRPRRRQGRPRRASGATSPATASCAGSGPRRASSTSRRPRSSTPSGTCGRAPTASRCGGCSPTSPPASSSPASTSAT